MTINAPASVLLLLYQLTAEQQGVEGPKLTGTLAERRAQGYIARGTYIPAPAVVADGQRHLRLLP